MRNLLPSNWHDALLCVFGTTLLAAVTIADFQLSGQFAVSLGYAAVVLLGLAARSRAVVLLLATLGTLASVAVNLFDISAYGEAAVAANRGMEIVAVWVVAGLVYYARRGRPDANPAEAILDRDDILEAFFNQTFQFAAALDCEGNIVEANQTLRHFAGLSTKEIQSMPIWLLPIFQNDLEARERLQSAVVAAAAGDFIRQEFVVSGIGDRPIIIDLTLKPLRDEGGFVRRIIMEARDITEARTQQEMLVQAQKMEAVGELTAGVAHDFNNLLTVIVGNLELLEKRLADNEGARDRLDRAIKAAFRGQALTQQLLAFSRRQPLNPVVIDVNTMLRGMSQMYEALGDDVRIEFDLADDMPPCEVDPTLLETALLNIAINARDAMSDGGVLRFQSEHLVIDESYRGEITDLLPGDYICLTVSDTGEGISQEIISQVFDPFFTTKPEGQGTGLGLSMVYGFVRQSGGDVKIYSEIEVGTTIRLYLPVTDKPLVSGDAGQADVMSAPKVQGKAVLLVDDDDEVRNLVLNTLQDVGCRVETASSGDSAIELIRAGNEYDLIFTDIVMAGEADGPDVARAARAVAPGVPVVFCSGFPRKTLDGDEASFDGAFFLAKPFHRNELIGVVERAFERSNRHRSLAEDADLVK